MAKRRTKKRTHRKVSEEELAKIPRSMVLRIGSSLRNHSLTQLVKDFRNVMQPHTAINLRERKSNKLKDFVVMAGPLGVSDLFIFNQSEESGNISLRLGKMPRGPTLQFKINSYSLMKDVSRILKRPKSAGKDSKIFHNPPLLVMNGFQSKVKEASQHEQLLITMFQNLFPPIQPQSTNVASIQRVLMINKDPETQEISLRHYAINTKLVDGNRNVKKLINSHHNLKKSLPNLSKATDVADMLLDPYSVGGVTSDSEVEDDAIVEIKNNEAITKKKESEKTETAPTRKRAIKLTELGPRINMTLMKIEEGLIGSSKTIYHSQVSKDEKDIQKLNEKHALKQKLKAERRAKQQANVASKLKVKEEKKKRKLARKNGEDMNADGSGSDSDSDDEKPEIRAEDYENDSDLYSDVEMSD
ncbi:hypothetical protein PGUG_05501 [Meyerozyma guilliermondii ATCC 6260]|uniref:Brix domain-containing protein n=1 Tax=Meyerozyma guilliermondii (strain ATCC 6260 / CBS 566 / DSM 6381 / JCM 1539 / NBRC 10279 / NRRL Y-324) TaxID=294746 RepID=A5DQF0_PICGU|nr:uncharacterized protein PGUG_05501 [Meyerozyma guilliermondii ATCC 6260]EDK41403.2 hypothetical protein PGUG_05501 [Meyerozyma guilliermondii ATCC 6260]